MKAKPSTLTVVAALTLASGVINLLWGIGIILGALGSIVGALCAPIGIYPLALGVLEVIFAAKLLSTPTPGLKAPKWLAIMEISDLATGNLIATIVRILALVFYGDSDVVAYFASLAPPAPPVPPEPPALPT